MHPMWREPLSQRTARPDAGQFRQARPPVPEGACPVCQLSLRHDDGCPYEGLGMPQAWARYRRTVLHQPTAIRKMSARPGWAGQSRSVSSGRFIA
jgi:hypothetical protein